MSFLEIPISVFDQTPGVSVLDLKRKPRWMNDMAGDRAGRRSKGPRHPTMVRLPVDHYLRYAGQAEELKVPVGDFIAYRMAVCEGLTIPEQVLMANPGLLALLPADQRAAALAEIPGLAARHQALFGAAPLPIEGLTTAGAAREDTTRAA